jgi:hypothetical protein
MSIQKRRSLPAALLRELFRYEPETGKLFCKIDYGQRKAGWPAPRSSKLRRDRRIFLRLSGIDYSVPVLIWTLVTGSPPTKEIDHIDRDPQNNRWNNLRELSRGENQANTAKYKNNKTGLRGVHRHNGRYRAFISVDGKNRHLGYFDTPEEAGAAWEIAASVRCG